MSDKEPAPVQLRPPDPVEENLPEEEAPLGAPQVVQTTLSLPHLIRVAVINLLVLAELFFAVYKASQNPDEFTPVFYKVFFALFVPTLILGIVSKRFIRPKRPQ